MNFDVNERLVVVQNRSDPLHTVCVATTLVVELQELGT